MIQAGQDLLAGFFQRAALDAERRVSRVRLLLCALGVLNVLLAGHAHGSLLALGPKYPIMLLALAVLGAFSLRVSRIARVEDMPPRLVERSVALEVLAGAAVIGPSVIWPGAEYRGLLSMPHAFAFPLGMIAAALRLSRPAVALGIGGHGAVALALIGYDLARHRAAALQPLDDYTFYAIILVVSALLSWSTVGHARQLVREGGAGMVREERARQALSVYLSQPVAAAAMEETTLRPGGERRTVAVLFADLRNFTAWSATLPPERLVDELNAWLELMVGVVREEGGVVDKYIGDAIMAVWGVPQATGDEAARAVRAARRMLDVLEQHNRLRAARGLPPLKQGVGVHYGSAIAGNVGAPERLQYTVMGDAVNLASRLEQATKELGAPVLISEAAAESALAAGAQGLVPLGRVAVRGRAETLPVYGLAGAPISLIPAERAIDALS